MDTKTLLETIARLDEGTDINFFLNRLFEIRNIAVDAYTDNTSNHEEREIKGTMYRVFHYTICEAFDNKLDTGALKVLLVTRLVNDIKTLEQKFNINHKLMEVSQ